MTTEEKKNILKKSAEDVYNDHFISGEIWLFKKHYNDAWFKKYDEFKKYISKKLEVHYNDIGIAGSAKLGFSLNPEKNLKDFDETSDIDIIVVSQYLYEQFWKEYLNDSYNPTTKVNHIYSISFAIFRGYIYLDGFRNNEFYNQWCVQTLDFEKDLQLNFNIENEIHYRIFKSWDAVKMYYLTSIIDAQKKLEENV